MLEGGGPFLRAIGREITVAKITMKKINILEVSMLLHTHSILSPRDHDGRGLQPPPRLHHKDFQLVFYD